LLRKHRKRSCVVHSENMTVRLQGQAPLHAGNIAFEDNWALDDLIECLNGFVFFWPGTELGPCRYGRNHFDSSSWDETPVALLKVRTANVFQFESSNRPHFCRFNSGAPRCVNGRKSPRGRSTFLPPSEFVGTPARVSEVVFRGSLFLPHDTEFAVSPEGPWRSLFESA
jgi:hypothetical protein